MTLNFFDCVQHRGHRLASFADNYFNLPIVSKAMGYRTFTVIEKDKILMEVKTDQNPLLTFLLTVLKVASYATVILPLIILAIKASSRAQLMRELKNPSEVKKDTFQVVPPALKKLAPSLLDTLEIKTDKKKKFCEKEFSSLADFNKALLALMKEELKGEDKLTLLDLTNGDLGMMVDFATFATSIQNEADAKAAKPLLEDILNQFIDILSSRLKKYEKIDISKDLNSLQKKSPSESLFSQTDALMMGMSMGESIIIDMSNHLNSPVKEKILKYTEETKTILSKLCGSVTMKSAGQQLKSANSDLLKSSQKGESQKFHPQAITKILAPPKKINQVTTGQELKKILGDPETKKNGYRVDIDVSEKAVIDYLKEGGKPELVGTFFYCLDLRDPILAVHAEAIVRHATRLVEIQGLNGENAPVLIPLLGKCENLKHLHLELEWGKEDVDLSPLVHHHLGRVQIVGEGVKDATLRSLKGASIQKIRLPSDIPLKTLEFVIQNLKPQDVSFWNHFAGDKANTLLRSYRLENLKWKGGVLPMNTNPKNEIISPYLDPNIEENSPQPSKMSHPCQTITADQVKELKQALNNLKNDEIVITTNENAVLAYLKEGGDPAKVANFFKCLDLRKPTLAQYAEKIIPYAPRLVEIQGLDSKNAAKLMPLLAKYCPKLRHIHIDIRAGEPAPNFDDFKGRDLGCLTLLGPGVGEKVFEKLQGLSMDGLYIPVINNESDARSVVNLRPGKIAFWHGFAGPKVEGILESYGYQNLRWSYDVGVADDYEKSKEIIHR